MAVPVIGGGGVVGVHPLGLHQCLHRQHGSSVVGALFLDIVDDGVNEHPHDQAEDQPKEDGKDGIHDIKHIEHKA